MPALRCQNLPIRAGTILITPVPVKPLRNEPGQACLVPPSVTLPSRALRYRAGAYRSRTSRVKPAVSHQTAPCAAPCRPTLRHHSGPRLPCVARTYQSEPCQTAPKPSRSGHGTPSRSLPGLRCRTSPLRAMRHVAKPQPLRAMSNLPCIASPDVGLHRRAKSNSAESNLSAPALCCPSGPKPSSSHRVTSRLPCQATPDQSGTHRI